MCMRVYNKEYKFPHQKLSSKISQEESFQNKRTTLPTADFFAEKLGVKLGSMEVLGPPLVLE